jgi:hypothetical protein
MTVAQTREKVFHLALLALFAIFFTIPIAGLFMFDCKFYPPKRFVSLLLLFFR